MDTTCHIKSKNFRFVIVMLLSFLVLRTSGQLSAPTSIQITRFPVVGVKDTQLAATCTCVGGTPAPTVYWYRDGGLFDSSFSMNSGAYINDMTFLVTEQEKNVNYECRCTNSQDEITSSKSLADVYVKPSNPIISGPSSVNAGATNITWTCETSGAYPLPKINWWLDGTSISGTSSTTTQEDGTYSVISTVTFTPTTADNNKDLRCEVIHTQTLDTGKSTAITLTVNVPPTVTIVPTNVDIERLQKVTFSCSGSSPLAVTEYQWYFVGIDGVPNLIQSNLDYEISANQKHLVVIADVTTVGLYYCRAKNAVGWANSTRSILTMYAEPYDVSVQPLTQTINESGNINIHCNAKGAPSVTYTWTFNNQVVSVMPNLAITGASYLDAGTYICTVNNTHGSKAQAVSVNVQYAPKSNITVSQYTKESGSSLTLSCDTFANPSPSVYVWRQGGTIVQGETQKTFEFTVVYGLQLYQCTATNVVGTSPLISFSVNGTGDPPATSAPVNTPSVGLSETSQGLSTLAIVLIVLLAILLVFVLIIIIACCYIQGFCCFWQKKKHVPKKRTKVKPSSEKLQEPLYSTTNHGNFFIHENGKPGISTVSSDKAPSEVSRNHVDVQMDNGYLTPHSDVSSFYIEAPTPRLSSAVDCEERLIISVKNDKSWLEPLYLPPLTFTYKEEERRRRKRRKSRKHKKSHHSRPQLEKTTEETQSEHEVRQGYADIVNASDDMTVTGSDERLTGTNQKQY